MAKTKGVNEKKQKGMELKAVNKATKDSAKAADNERQEGTFLFEGLLFCSQTQFLYNHHSSLTS